jgi:hypothetical protein
LFLLPSKASTDGETNCNRNGTNYHKLVLPMGSLQKPKTC